MENNEYNINSLPKETGFQVPERYFEALPSRVMQRTAQSGPIGATAPFAWLGRFKMLAAGVSMALVFVISFFTVQTLDRTGHGQSASLGQIPQDEIAQYLLTRVELETADVAEVTASRAPQALEFLQVSHEDVNVEAALEILQDESHSIDYNED
ncbi:hypothetical protein [Rufibacter sp. LB8]|uniref:hypothetical protein n=1 Tax=Rufibacter sp. LB8 TaxID=2777781 RepID=UPI00178C48F4|nr:hypothetical protein [Rufibacter sp. LB8]